MVGLRDGLVELGYREEEDFVIGVRFTQGDLIALREAKRPMAKGSYFLVDKNGVIRGKWMNPPGELFPNDTFLKAARELEERS